MRGTGEARARQRTFSERMLVPKHWVESLIDPDDDPPPPAATGPPPVKPEETKMEDDLPGKPKTAI
jgi:hypothetical protein